MSNRWKNVVKAAVFCLPLILYAFIFIKYEPYNYWGLRDDLGDTVSAVTVIRRALRSDCKNIVIGASKMANLDTDDLIKMGLTDEKWTNLSFNGASVSEECELLRYIIDSGKDVKKVTILTSFWSALVTSGVDRVKTAIDEIALDPAGYVFSPNSHVEAFNAFLNTNLAKKTSGSTETYKDNVTRIWTNAMESNKYAVSWENKLIEVVKYCKERNIEISIGALPLRQEVFEFIRKYGREDELHFYKEVLSEVTEFYDMEYEESAWTDSTEFIDSMHFKGYDQLTDENFSEEHPVLMDVLSVAFKKEGQEVKRLNHSLQMEEVFKINNLNLPADGESHFYSAPINLEPDSIYLVSIKGNVGDIDAKAKYMQFYVQHYSDYYNSFTELSKSDDNMTFWVYSDIDDNYWAVIQTGDLITDDYNFVIKYQSKSGDEEDAAKAVDLQIEELGIYRYSGFDSQREAEKTERMGLDDILDSVFDHGGKKAEFLKEFFEDESILSAENIQLPGDTGELQQWFDTIRLDPNSTYLVACQGDLTEAKISSETFYIDCFTPYYSQHYNSIEEYAASVDSVSFVPSRLPGTDDVYWMVFDTGDLTFDTFAFRIIYQGTQGLNIDWLDVYKLS